MASRRNSAPLSLDEALWELIDALEESPDRRALLSRLLGSPEFQELRRAARAPTAPSAAQPPPAEADDAFVRGAYRRLLGREADPDGLAHYVRALAGGESRVGVVRALALSDEFERRACGLPSDTQLCELANPAKWENPEWLAILRSLGLADDRLAMHRKPYEFAQLVYGCRRLGALNGRARVVSVGAGHELILYWLANHVGQVVATDLYEGVWQHLQGREGDPDVIRRPEAFAPFDYRRERLRFLRMDGRRLAFRDGSFDIAYSLSSIEHFGGLAGAEATMAEMARVLRPGGILALATEYVLEGPPHAETFQPDEFARLIDQPGLELVEPLDDRVYRRYRCEPVDLYADPYQTPHMVVRFADTVFTTAMVFLRRRAA
jgi:SAM-dependent methyltransferase